MRFASLTLERFGAFTDRRLDFDPHARLHIVHGANEAGKTSALAAISDLLFGFGHTTAYAFLHAATNLRLGASLRLGNGAQLDFRRRKGRSNTLVDANEQPLPDDILAPVTGTLSRESFGAEFGLTAEALRQGGRDLVKTGGRLAEMLAAGSAGLSALSRLAVTLDEEANALFSERRFASKPFYLAEDKYKAAEKGLRDAIITVDAWNAANAAVDQARKALAGIESGQQSLSAELARLERIRRTGLSLRQLDAIADRLAALETLPDIEPEYPPLWRAALSDDIALSQRLAELDDETAAAEARTAQLALDPAVIQAAPLIEALRERIGAIDKARDDLPRRIADRDEAAGKLGEAARHLGFASIDALLAGQPAAGLDDARQKLAAWRSATQAQQNAQQALAERHAARARFAEASEAEPHVLDPVPLKRRLDGLANIPQDADRLARETQALARDDRRIAEDLARLEPVVPGADALLRLPLPEAELIHAARIEAEALARQADDLDSRRAVLAIAQDKAQRDIDNLIAHGPLPSRNDLAVAREARDAAMLRLAAALEADSGDRRALFAAALALGQRADDIADQLLGDSDRATRRLAAEQRGTEAQQALLRLDGVQEALAARHAQAQRDWAQLWQASGLAPLSPARMLAWRDRLRDIMDRHGGLEARRIETAILAERLVAQRPALEALALDLRHQPRAESLISGLYREVSTALAEVQEAWNAARTRVAEAKMLDRNCAEAETALAKASQQLQAASDGWPAAAAALGLPADAGMGAAETAIAIWAGVSEPRVIMLREKRSVDSINADVAAFGAAVVDLLAQAAPDLATAAPRQALDMLVQRLAAMRKIEAERLHLQAGQSQRQAKRDDLIRKSQRAKSHLAEARLALGLSQEAGLGAALDMIEARAAARFEQKELEAQLQQQADGYAQDQLRAEQAGVDADQVAGLLQACNERGAAARHDFAEATVAWRAALQARDSLAAGRNAEAHAQARIETGADMARIGEAWLVRAVAVRLARAAIERHRASAQDPVIARASTLFAIVTSGGFSGLASDFDDQDTPSLVGRRANGSKVKVQEMSEGTRDQLFLVLRLALLEQRGGETMPFVGDDLLASFDEIRTGEMLDVLAQFGARQQVILFTHHAHVVEIARARLGSGVDVVSL